MWAEKALTHDKTETSWIDISPSVSCCSAFSNREEPESLIAKALLAREFVDNCVSRDLAEDETWTEAMPQCSVHEASNHTLRRLGASINRCQCSLEATTGRPERAKS